MSKQSKEKNFSERLKRFLKGDKKNIKNEWEIFLSEDVKAELGPLSPLQTRIKAIKELHEVIANRKMNEVEIRKLWMQVRDLAKADRPTEERHLVLSLLSTASSTTDQLGLTRQYFFNHIVDVYLTEDVNVLFKFLCIITNDGKLVKDIELEIGAFLALWLSSLLRNISPATPVITFTTTLFKYNAAFITDYAKHELVKILIVYENMSFEEMDAFLHFMDSLVAYCYIPEGLLVAYIATLARHISVPRLVEPTWKVMRNLLRTSLGNTAVFAICEIIETYKDFHRVRGCIYFLSNALWTSNRVASISLNPMAVLPTLQTASENRHPLIIYETAISIHKLVSNMSAELYLVSWKVVLTILSRLFFYTANYENKEQALMIFNVLHSTLDVIDEMIDSPLMWQISPQYFDLVDVYSEQRKVTSVLKLLEYKFKVLSPNEDKWTAHLNSLMHKHFKQDPRYQIRLHALEQLAKFFKKFQYPYGEVICNKVILIQLDELEKESNVVVRKAGISLLLKAILALNIPALEQMLYFIEKVVVSIYSKQNEIEYQESDVQDIAEGINGLINVFKQKIWTFPSSYSIQAYQILVAFLELHYVTPQILASVPAIRTEIFKMIFEMRADSSYHLGLPNCPEAIYPFEPDEAPAYIKKFSHYIVVDHKFGLRPTAGFSAYKKFSIGSPENLNIQPYSPQSDESIEREKGGNNSIDELKFEEDFKSNEKVESKLQLKNEYGVTIDMNEGVSNLQISDDVPISDEVAKGQREPSALKVGAGDDSFLESSSEIAHLSLTNAARLVILAMKQERDWPLLKLILDKIPEVLQNKALILSKDGNDIDFLAVNLCSLVTDQKLSTSHFANLPPGFRRTEFNCCVYPVMANLAAYHDLNMIYKKKIIQCLQSGMQSDASALCIRALTLCALEMRKAMSKMLSNVMFSLSKMSATVINAQPSLEFLSTLLHLPRVYCDFLPDQYQSVFAIAIPYTNPFKFNHYIVLLAYHVIAMWFLKCRLPYRKKFVNYISKNLHMILEQEDPSKFKTTSYNEQHLKSESEMMQFHKDLRETCIDFMSRNCFDSFSPLCRRKPVSDFLLNAGQTQMWLVGTRLITITTSGCSQKPLSNGLCDKCVQLCSSGSRENIPQQEDPMSRRRRHRSEFHRQVSNEAKYEPQSKDDLHMTTSYHEDSLSYFHEKDDSAHKLRKDTGSLSHESSSSPSILKGVLKEHHLCACWCKGWAEVYIRQPTGNISYMMRIQNLKYAFIESDDLPLDALSSLISPFYSNNSEPYEMQDEEYAEYIRLRAFSGDSDRTLASEAESGIGGAAATDWNYSGSVPSSGTASLASSDLRLHHLPDCEAYDKEQTAQHRPVCHCHSNPETNRGTASTDGALQLGLSSASDTHSKAAALERSTDNLFATKIKTRTASGTVRRSNSIVGSPSPPPSSVTTSRTRHVSALQMSTPSTSAVTPDDDVSIDLTLQPMKRGRGHTISDMAPSRKGNLNLKKLLSRRPTLGHTGTLVTHGSESAVGGNATSSSMSLRSEGSSLAAQATPSIPQTTSSSSSSISSLDGKLNQKEGMGGVSPSSVFLQLFYHGPIGGGYMRPIPLPQSIEIERAIKLLDLIKPQENHKIGVLYVGPYQISEAQILRNGSGSLRYLSFLEGLGTVYNFSDLPDDIFLGGLDKRGVDGDYVYLWHDDIMQIVFHVATAMPNKEKDLNCNDKKRHIGNDYVTIVYNERDNHPYTIDTIKSQFNHAVVEIVPGDHNTNLVRLLCRPDLGDFINWTPNEHPRLVSDNNLPVLVRQIALHANLASMIWEAQKRSDSYSPYWLQRLWRIKNIREKTLGAPEAERQYQDQQQQIFGGPLGEKSDSPFLDFIDLIDFDKPDAKDKQKCRYAQ